MKTFIFLVLILSVVAIGYPRLHRRHTKETRFLSWLKHLDRPKFETPLDNRKWKDLDLRKFEEDPNRFISHHERRCRERAAAFAMVACNHPCARLDRLLHASCGSEKFPEDLKQYEMGLLCCPYKLDLDPNSPSRKLENQSE